MWKVCCKEDALRTAEMAVNTKPARDMRIVAFFVLLNRDTVLKTQIRDLGGKRAAGLYMAFSEILIPAWMQNETKRIGEM
eukprot:3565131-Rhodomonas_salina.1